MGCVHSNERMMNDISQPNEEQIKELLQRQFTRSEILNWHRIFLAKCPISSFTPCINKCLFIDYFKQLHPTGDVNRLTELFFHAFDRNNDGMIDFIEFMQAIAMIGRNDSTERLAFIFSLLDSDRTDYIDRVKFVQIFEALYDAKGWDYTDGYNVLLNKVDRIIIRLDREKNDGRIDRSKFIDNCNHDPLIRDLLKE